MCFACPCVFYKVSLFFIQRLDETIDTELKSLHNTKGSDDLSPIKLQSHLQQTLHNHTICLEQHKQHLKKIKLILVALENFLSHLQKVNEDLSAAQKSSASNLASVRQSLHQVGEESVQLDRILDDAGMRIASDDKPSSCHEIVSAMVLHAEDVEARPAVKDEKGKEVGEQRERSFGTKRLVLQVTLREVLAALEKHSLKEPTLPALQQR